MFLEQNGQSAHLICASKIQLFTIYKVLTQSHQCALQCHCWGHTFTINVLSNFDCVSFWHHSIILSVNGCQAPCETSSGLGALNSEGEGQWKVETEKGRAQVWEIWQVALKNALDSQKRGKVSQLATQSVNHVMFYAAVIHSVRHLISLAVSHSPSLLLCQLFCHSAWQSVSLQRVIHSFARTKLIFRIWLFFVVVHL